MRLRSERPQSVLRGSLDLCEEPKFLDNLHVLGTFESVQYLDVLGPVADSQNPFHLQQRVIYSVPLALTATADPVTTKKQPVFKPGEVLHSIAFQMAPYLF